MSADQVTPVTDNEREMQSGGACGLHGVYVGRRCPRCAQISEVEGTVPSAWYLDMKRERDRLVAALSAAEREASAQMGSKLEAQMALRSISEALDLPFDKLGTGWTEGALTIISRIEEIVDEGERGFRERDEARAALSAATTEREREQRDRNFWAANASRERQRLAERAEGLAAQLQQTREALQRAQSLHAEQLQAIDDGDDFGEHVGIVRHRRAVYQGQAEIISLWEDALAAAAPATTLNEPEGEA